MQKRLAFSTTAGNMLCLVMIIYVAKWSFGENIQQDINKDVWIPLFAASDAFDADGFLAVQSKDLVRISVDTKEVYGFDRYEKEIREGFKRAKERGLARKSDARFLERNASENFAHEIGYFRSKAILPGREDRIRYSKFEFVMRKENGRWVILIDKDTSDGGQITETQFLAATPMSE